jgi:hypothetical protein
MQIVYCIVCPIPSIDYPGTRVFYGFFKYSTTRVFGLSTRVVKLKLYFTNTLNFFFNIKLYLFLICIASNF